MTHFLTLNKATFFSNSLAIKPLPKQKVLDFSEFQALNKNK